MIYSLLLKVDVSCRVGSFQVSINIYLPFVRVRTPADLS